MLNARTLVEAEAAVMIPQKEISGQRLAEVFDYYYAHPDELAAMTARAAHFGRPDAARIIVDDCYRLMDADSLPVGSIQN